MVHLPGAVGGWLLQQAHDALGQLLDRVGEGLPLVVDNGAGDSGAYWSTVQFDGDITGFEEEGQPLVGQLLLVDGTESHGVGLARKQELPVVDKGDGKGGIGGGIGGQHHRVAFKEHAGKTVDTIRVGLAGGEHETHRCQSNYRLAIHETTK